MKSLVIAAFFASISLTSPITMAQENLCESLGAGWEEVQVSFTLKDGSRYSLCSKESGGNFSIPELGAVKKHEDVLQLYEATGLRQHKKETPAWVLTPKKVKNKSLTASHLEVLTVQNIDDQTQTMTLRLTKNQLDETVQVVVKEE